MKSYGFFVKCRPLNQKQLMKLNKVLKKFQKKLAVFICALPSNSDIKIILKTAKPQFVNAKDSSTIKNKRHIF